MPQRQFRQLLNQFNVAIRDCRGVYINGGKIVVEQHPHLLDQAPSMFLEMMDELHRGLLIKMYISICGYNHIFTREEEMMAQVLVQHLWRQDISTKQFRDSIHTFRRHADALQWEALVRPFRTIEPLQPLTPDLETCIMRIGNMMAKADGKVTPEEIEELRSIQRQLLTYLNFESTVREDSASRYESSSRGIQIMNEDARQIKQNREASISRDPLFDANTHPTTLDDEIIDLSEMYADQVKTDQDSQPEEKGEQLKLEQVIAELTSLIGLDSIKEEVRSLTNFLKVQKMRLDKGLPETNINLHMVFEGNPGTGKTTVARIVGKIFGALGILEKGHVVETDRSGLVAEFAGQTGPKTNKTIDSALDGILFVDEAYSLVAEGQGGDPFGQEAVQTLLKRMEDDRDRLVVIMAGYPAEMDNLLKSNPGLSSRIGKRLTFDDYAPRELGEIFGKMCQQNHYAIQGEAQAKAIIGLSWLFENRDEHFGNGRTVRNIFEQAIRRLSNRVIEVKEITEELLTSFQAEDILFDGVPDELFLADKITEKRYRIQCENCQSSAVVKSKTLGRRVACRKCQHKFVAQWGEPR